MMHVAALLAGAALAAVQENQAPSQADRPAEAAEDAWEIELLPAKNIYMPYLADPRTSRTSTKVSFPVDSRKGNIKIESSLGTTRPLALWKNSRCPAEEAELFIEAAVFSRFDLSKDWDMDGADYRFGFPFAYRLGDVALKFHVWHLTSHLGDEYMTREQDRKRDSYHLDEAALGISWQAAPSVRAYGEIGYAFYVGPATEEGRVQVGLEWTGERWGKMTPYAAADASTREEIDWDWNLTLQVGIIFRSNPEAGGLRFLLEYYRGHDQQTQFKSDRDQYFAFGVAAEL